MANLSNPSGVILEVDKTEVFNGTPPTTYTDLDLSAWIGSNAAEVFLVAENLQGSAKPIMFRRNGETDQVEYGVVADGSQSSGKKQAYKVLTSVNGIIEWRVQSGAATWKLNLIGNLKKG